jgi:serine/threonine protein kinase
VDASQPIGGESTRALPVTARPVEDLDPSDPLTIKSYRLLGRLGGIHLSDVYLAEQPLTGALCVVKVAGATQFNETERFQREAQYLGRIHSLRAAKMLESGLWQGRPFLVQEFVDGPTLADLIRNNNHEPCEIGDSYRIARGLAEALRDVHKAGVVHRDVKPANIIVSNDRGVTLVDFGIALAGNDPRITLQGTTLGTPRYMSPEQWYSSEVTEASDVFGWGVVVGESLLGRHPILGMDEDWRGALERCTPDPGLTGAIGRLVTHALDQVPAMRPSLADILRQLDLTEAIEAPDMTRTTIQLPDQRLRDARSAGDVRELLAPRVDDVLDQIATRPGVFAAAVAVAVVLGWVIGYFAGVVAAAPWGNA